MYEKTWQKQIKRKKRVTLAFFLCALAFLITLLIFVPNLLFSAVLAIFINYMFKPLVGTLERRGITRGMATGLIFTVVTVGFILLSLKGYPFFKTQTEAFKNEWPYYLEKWTEIWNQFQYKLEDFWLPIDWEHITKTYFIESTSLLAEHIPAFLSQSMVVLFLGPFFAFFILKDGRPLSQYFFSLIPNHFFELSLNLKYQINEQVGNFVRARVMEAFLVGFIVWVGLFILGFPFDFFLALFAGLTNLIPYVGPFIGFIPALAIAFVKGMSWSSMLLLLIPYLLAQILDVVLILPFLVARIVGLHPITILVSLIIGAQLLGVVGMIICIPVTSALKLTLSAIYQHLVEFRS